MTLRVVIATDSFKGSATAEDATRALARGWLAERPGDDVRRLPTADGGEGTLDALAAAIPGAVRRDAGMVTGPAGEPTPGHWLHLPDGTAVVELAVASGLPLLRSPAPLTATTRGTGDIVVAALDAGAERLVITLGGSASTDGGAGLLQALGLRLRDVATADLAPGGAALLHLVAADRSALRDPPRAGITLLTDVTAPLLGPQGAAAAFGPQKGATAADVQVLERALARYARILGGQPDRPGAGAAGGTAYGVAAVWGGEIRPGFDAIAELTGLRDAIEGADVVLTGEGRYDETSSRGKAVGGVLRRAGASGARTAVIAGRLDVPPPGFGLSLEVLAGSSAAALDDPLHWLERAGALAAQHFSH